MKLNAMIRRLSILFLLLASAQASAQNKAMVVKSLPAQCDLAICWMGELKPDANGSAPEKWLAQPEIQNMFSKLQEAIKKSMSGGPISDEMSQALATELPGVMMQQPWVAYVPNLGNTDELPGNAATMMMLIPEGETQQKVKTLIKTQLQDKPTESLTLYGSEFSKVNMGSDNPELQIGFHKNFLMVGGGVDSLKELFSNAKTGTPNWAKEIVKQAKMDRVAGFMNFSASSVLKSFNDGPLSQQIPDYIGLDEFKGISAVIGIKDDRMVAHGVLKCPRDGDGIFSLFDGEALTTKSLNQIPDNVDTAFAVNLKPAEIWNFIDNAATQENDPTLKIVSTQVKQITGLGLDEIVQNHLTGAFYSYSVLDLVNPAGKTIIGLGIKDVAPFRKALEKAVTTFQQQGVPIEPSDSSGNKIYTVNVLVNDAGDRFAIQPGVEPSFCLVDDFLYIGMTPGAVRTHLRKVKRPSGKLSSNEQVQRMFDKSVNGGQPMGFYYMNTKKMLELGSSMLSVAGPFLQQSEFEFDLEDIPSADILARGVEPNLVGIYRKDDGIHLVEHHSIPGVATYAISGVAVGMLLPAIQQVRYAARRTQSMNNIRQLILAAFNYESANKSFPAAYSQVENGKPLLSWRVHLLPHLGQQELYEKFRLDEPWDSPDNKKLIELMPAAFDNPNLALEPGKTSYLGVSGKSGVLAIPDSANKTGRGIGLGSISDGASNTIMILESNSENAAIWTKPDYLDADAVEDVLSIAGGIDGINAGFADGSVQTLRDVDNQSLKKMMTRNGGEVVER